MGKLVIGPEELRDQHVKVYVEKSVRDALRRFQLRNNLLSESEAARTLIVFALEHIFALEQK